MQITINNCNNVETGTINIDEGKLNIKYGINGTGKSTIANAIQLHILNNGDISILKPFNTSDDITPIINLSSPINSVKVFNTGYVSQYLFLGDGDDLLPNSFEVFIKPDNYDESITTINSILSVVKDYVLENEIINNLITQKNELTKILKLNKAKTSINDVGLGKALNNGNKTHNISPELSSFQQYINNFKSVAWYDWQITGREFKIDNSCPFCTTILSDEFEELLEKIDELFDKKNVDSVIKGSTIIENISSNITDTTNAFLNQLFINNNPITAEDKNKVVRFIIELENICNNLSFFLYLDFINVRNIQNLEEQIISLKINTEELEFFGAEQTLEIINNINNKIDELLNNMQNLTIAMNILNSSMRTTTTNNLNRINNFLVTIGMNYQVEIKNNKLILNFKETNIIVNPNKHLSWGEKNCFALALFLFDCLYNNCQLIILDDPVSSFDLNKKYAITHYLFNTPNSLKGKTVLMFTHDLEPIINMLKIKSFPFVNCSYIENNNKILSEVLITKEDVDSIINVTKSCYQNTELNIINRLVHLRRFLELNNEYNLEYNMLSSLLKGKEVPRYINNIKRIDRDFTDEEFQNTNNRLKLIISDFTYSRVIDIIKDKAQMKSIYINSGNKYEKIEIFRIMCKCFIILNVDDVLTKFIDEAFHVENSYIFQLDPYAYNLVPNYIVEKCDQLISRIITEELVMN